MPTGSDRLLTEVRRARCTIVFADLAESVRLMRDHEADAIARWRAFAAEVRETLAGAWGGRVVRTAGDGLLIECERPGGAVGLSLAMHARLAEANVGRPDREAMLLRIGLHETEVVFDEHEAYGSGVNLAQRLAGLAAPGGTVVSPTVRDGLVDGVEADIVDLGLRYVKHVDEPVRAYAVSAPHASGSAHGARLPADEDLRPTLAVVPFVAMPSDPEHDALGHAMADDVIATLARHPALRVLSRLTTAGVRDATLGLPRLRELLGATFVLGGRFYVRGGRVRLAAELSDLRDGRVIWTGQHVATIEALFEGADDLVPQLVQRVAETVLAHELLRVRSLPMDSLASYTLLLGAGGLLNSLVPVDFHRAREVLEHLAERHPRQAALHAMLSGWHTLRMIQGWSDDTRRDADGAWVQAQRALDLDPRLPDALLADSTAQILRHGDFDAATRSCLAALAIHPQHPMGWAQRSETQRVAGDAEAALASAQQALTLSPLDPQLYMFEAFAASAALEAGRYGTAEQHARASIRRHALHAPPHLVLICALWMDGRHDAARIAARQALQHLPQLRVGARISAKPGAASLTSPYARALLDAGLPP